MNTPTSDAGTALRHESAVQASRADRSRMLKALDALEAALAAGSVRDQSAWSRRVMAALSVLEKTMASQTKELDSDQGLLAGILDQAPRFERQVGHLRDQFTDLVRQVESLHKQFHDSNHQDPHEVSEIRQRIAWIITAIRHFQACESDLLQEAFTVDIGVGD